ncbi:MAG TPA: glycosyltransferase family 2 protein [Ignavibacteriaceae bacterium]|nr:glycosyltransferase family 2 protein [Ignavibacteriaceae bacterium]
MNISVIIPAYNEESSIAKVIRSIPHELINEVVVVNNNSSDNTEAEAVEAGATVLNESIQGYGASCLRGIGYLKNKNTDIVVFLDGDYSDYPEEMHLLLKPILNDGYDFVLGSRILGNREAGSMPFHSRFGNIFSGYLINFFWRVKYTDLGPFRAIRFDKLLQLDMRDHWYGWTVEMQIKAIKYNLRIKEVPVSYRKRIGKSKVSGTIKGSFMAGTIILKTIFNELFAD